MAIFLKSINGTKQTAQQSWLLAVCVALKETIFFANKKRQESRPASEIEKRGRLQCRS